jgi:hypothetical protein
MPTPIQADCLKQMPGLAHGFFTREGGSSQGLYASLNCGVGSRDERARVLENRSRVAGALGTSGDRLITCYQTHSTQAVAASAPWTIETMPKADAVATATPGLAVGVLAADCAPVLFADPEARVVAAAHAGWKGALAGILEATIAGMEQLGAKRRRIYACIGPCIGPAAYEVGPEFEATFLDQALDNSRFFVRAAGAERPRFDLPAYVLSRLESAGLATVESATRCTYLNEAQFFSFRRTTHRREADYGRQISAIVLR